MAKQVKEIDLIIIGAGPAGLTADIYASRARLDMLLLEDKVVGGQVKNSYAVANYPGFIHCLPFPFLPLIPYKNLKQFAGSNGMTGSPDNLHHFHFSF